MFGRITALFSLILWGIASLILIVLVAPFVLIATIFDNPDRRA